MRTLRVSQTHIQKHSSRTSLLLLLLLLLQKKKKKKKRRRRRSMLDSPDGKQGSLCCLPGGGALQLLTKVGQVVGLQHTKRDLKHLLQTLLPANCNTVQKSLSQKKTRSEKKHCLEKTLFEKAVLRAALTERLHDELLSRRDQRACGASTGPGKDGRNILHRQMLQRHRADESNRNMGSTIMAALAARR